ncbi:hypothetical protein DH2020_026840 [Rehmannia glutinosa]|uniref:X8 domain-containing protein n=1 Tax=Rehmannia glutinosa TaxID=99300 RepID=A0ABR0VVT3_REHGL
MLATSEHHLFGYLFFLILCHHLFLDGWCVANRAAEPYELQAFLDYGCHELDCSPILPGGGCYEPNTLWAHSSWILDKFYRDGGFCKEDLGYITKVNPCKLFSPY